MKPTDDVPGVIDPACAYTVKELARRLGITKGTVLSWKPFGLKIYGKAGGRVTIVKGSDFIDWYTDTATKPGPRQKAVTSIPAS